MKPNFALSLSFDGLRLMHRAADGWHFVGEVALDDPDVPGALERLRIAAEGLDHDPFSTKLLIPNDQIRYLALDTTQTDEADVVAALDGATPYAVSDLVYDYAQGGGRTYIAAVARETLDEAEAFATENGFNPVAFAAVPEPFTFVGEAFFGPVSGQDVTRDPEPVIVTGTADVAIPAAPMTPPSEKGSDDATLGPVPDEAPAGEDPTNFELPDSTESETTGDDAAPSDDPTPEFEPLVPPMSAAPEEPSHDDQAQNDAIDIPYLSVPEEPASDTPGSANAGATMAALDMPSSTPDPQEDDHALPTAEPKESDEQAIDAADETPVFSSRLRADRNEGRPGSAASTATPSATETQRTEPTLGRAAPEISAPKLAVPTGQGTDAMPPVAAPRRDDAPAVSAPRISAQTPDPAGAPPITGTSQAALPADAAVAAASLTAEVDRAEVTASDDEPPAERKRGAAAAMGGAVGGMFASRRMARADAKSDAAAMRTDATAENAPDEKSRMTVFGARKKEKPKQVVGGKPRFLGLILTAILLLFLLAVAVLAAVSEDGLAGLFGFTSEDTQIAQPPAPDTAAPDDAAVPTVTATAPVEEAPVFEEPATADDVLATPTEPAGGTVLSPEEAARIYAATGVWQRAPRIPLTPRTTTIDGLALGAAFEPVAREAPSPPLADSSSVAGDALIATPVDPPPPDADFNFGDDGRIVATPEGAATPDGILVIAGSPPLNPPTRPGTVAPEITPQDQLAAVIPEAAAPVEDAPEGVIVISGRPAIEPPVRPGTAPPAPGPLADVLAEGEAPLVAEENLVVLSGTPPATPPARPGTAPDSADAEPQATVEAATRDQSSLSVAETVAAQATPERPEGLNLLSGPPPVLPPVRPGTTAPVEDASAAQALSGDVAIALQTGTAQTPDATTPRPQTRPDTVPEVAAAQANAPTLGDLTVAQAAAFRPQTRPAGLAPEPQPEETPEAEPAPVQTVAAPTGLQLAPEIAAAVEAAANRPNPIVNATAQAIAVSERPDTRPRNMDRIVARAQAAQQRTAQQVASVQPTTVAPSGPTGNAVARNATLENAINLREINLIGIFGGSNDRRALVRLANGRYVRVSVGDRLDSGRVTAISADALSYNKRGRAITLRVAG